MTEDRLLEEHRRESPAQAPSIVWEVVYPPLAFGAATYLLFAWLYWPAAGRGMAGAVMLVALGWRLWRFDRAGRGVHIVETRRYVEPSEPRRIRPMQHDRGDDGNGNRWRIGRWGFHESEWRRLWRAFEGGTVTRDGLAAVTRDNGERMFPNITSNYNEYLRQLRQMGWVDGDNVVTDGARAWFAERNLDSPTESA